MWQRIKIPATVLVLLAAAGYGIHQLMGSREWLEFRSDSFGQALAQVRWSYLVLGAAFIFSSYFFRSLRWRVFLAPSKTGGLGSVNLGNIFASTLIGFSAVALLGRPGELVRPLMIARKEQVDLSSQLGAWTLERIFDCLAVAIMIGAALLFSPPQNSLTVTGARMIAGLRTGGIILSARPLLLGVVLALLRSNAKALLNLLLFLAQVLPERYRNWLRHILESLLTNFTAALACIASTYGFFLCTAFSVLVWVPVISAYWVVTHALGQPLSSLGVGSVVLLLGVTVAGSLVQIPGVGGGPQIASILVLTQLFGIPLAIASTAAILLWTVSFLIVLVPGLPLAAREGLNWQRLRHLVKTPVQQ